MTTDCVSRAVISLALGVLLLVAGLPWWMSAFGVATTIGYIL